MKYRCGETNSNVSMFEHFQNNVGLLRAMVFSTKQSVKNLLEGTHGERRNQQVLTLSKSSHWVNI